jgi:hypothetical protein
MPLVEHDGQVSATTAIMSAGSDSPSRRRNELIVTVFGSETTLQVWHSSCASGVTENSPSNPPAV